MSSGIRRYLLPPVVQQILEGLLQFDLRLPPRRLTEALRVEREVRCRAGPHARRVDFRAYLDARELDERREDLADRHRMTGADIEDVRAGTVDVGGALVCLGHVAHVEEVATRVERTVAHDRGRSARRYAPRGPFPWGPCLSFGDLLRERGRREAGMLARPDLVRRPQDHDRAAAANAIAKLVRECFGGDLRRGVGVLGAQRRVLIDDPALRRAIDLGTRREDE